MMNLLDFLDSNWKMLLKKEIESDSFKSLLEYLNNEQKEQKIIFPKTEQIFSALNYCS